MPKLEANLETTPGRLNGGASARGRLSGRRPIPVSAGRGKTVRGTGGVGYTRVSIDIIILEL
jgi:hypothetical protein